MGQLDDGSSKVQQSSPAGAVLATANSLRARLQAAFDVPWERLLVELTITTGLRSGEVRGLVWDSIDLKGKRLFVEHQATRRRADDVTKTENSLRTVYPSFPRRNRFQHRRERRAGMCSRPGFLPVEDGSYRYPVVR